MRYRVLATAALAGSLALCGTGLAAADPLPAVPNPFPALPTTAPNFANIVRIDDLSPTRAAVFIASPSMGRVMQVQILHPASNAPRPTLYLLDGVDAPAEESNWTAKTDLVKFMADKNVNVVLPLGGTGSYYTDWEKPDPVLGVNRWETFLTAELPSLVDRTFAGNGSNVVGGLSMGGQGALTLITRHPDLYRGVAAYSACADSTNPNAVQAVRATIASKGGDANNMWGPDTDPEWIAHDPVTNAERLRGKTIYMSVGSGLPGPHELAQSNQFSEAVTQGGPLEVGARVCTQDFKKRLDSLHIRGKYNFRPSGTHSWPYWQDDFHNSWPTIATALGIY